MDSSSIDYRLSKLSLHAEPEKVLDMFPKVPDHVVLKSVKRIMELSNETITVRNKEKYKSKPPVRIRIPKSFTI